MNELLLEVRDLRKGYRLEEGLRWKFCTESIFNSKRVNVGRFAVPRVPENPRCYISLGDWSRGMVGRFCGKDRA